MTILRRALSTLGTTLGCSLVATCTPALAEPPAFAPQREIDAIYGDIETLYMDLHRSPELSLQEEKTAAKMAERLRRIGFEVTEHVGGHGVVGVLRNGAGPTVLWRVELDALPIEEKTGLPYASTVTAHDASGQSVHVMHACGHDVHMAAGIGAATLLARKKDLWQGTLVFVAQPAEERGGEGVGAKAMIADGLFTRFPKPSYALAIHDTADDMSGTAMVMPGYVLANANSLNVTIYGKSGHAAFPQETVDPIVIAAHTVLSLETMVTRDIDPRDTAVLSVGSIHGGAKASIIPDEVKLQLTVRSNKDEVQQRLLAGIERVVTAEATAGRSPKPPTITVAATMRAVYNDPALTERLAAADARALGAANVRRVQPLMAVDDFSEYGRAGIPSALVFVGAASPSKFANGQPTEALPALHSSSFAPDRERTLKTGMTVLWAETLTLLPHK